MNISWSLKERRVVTLRSLSPLHIFSFADDESLPELYAQDDPPIYMFLGKGDELEDVPIIAVDMKGGVMRRRGTREVIPYQSTVDTSRALLPAGTMDIKIKNLRDAEEGTAVRFIGEPEIGLADLRDRESFIVIKKDTEKDKIFLLPTDPKTEFLEKGFDGDEKVVLFHCDIIIQISV